MTKKEIKTAQAPEAIGPYSQAIELNGLVFLSGQIPIDPDSGELNPGGIGEQTRKVLTNLQAIVNEAGLSLDAIVKTTVYLTDLNSFAEMNAVYGEFFTPPFPARATVEVSALPKGAGVEIDAIATTKTDDKP